jgi:hypothetical protein
MSNLPRKVFVGYDNRQPVSFNVLQQSIINTAKKPVSITALVLPTLPLRRQGLTPFTWSRFLVPYLCDYQGWALFLDIDMILRHDISELFNYANDKYAVMVSKNEHKFEWASAILFNCAHASNKILTPDFIEHANALHQISWLKEDEVGAFPGEWNHLVGYDKERPDAKLVHYTQGVPAFEETSDSEYAKEWQDITQNCISTMPWEHLMGTSVHACTIKGKRLPRYKLKKYNVEEDSKPLRPIMTGNCS